MKSKGYIGIMLEQWRDDHNEKHSVEFTRGGDKSKYSLTLWCTGESKNGDKFEYMDIKSQDEKEMELSSAFGLGLSDL